MLALRRLLTWDVSPLSALRAMAVDVEHSHVRFLGDLVLNLWDCGGYGAPSQRQWSSIAHIAHMKAPFFDTPSPCAVKRRSWRTTF